MKKGTLIEHNKTTIICEESELIILSYNVLLTTPKANTIIKPTVHVATTKSTLNYINCGKTSQSLETCHNRKWEVSVVPTATIKSTEPIAKTKTQPVK
jgi:hypothetical protein